MFPKDDDKLQIKLSGEYDSQPVSYVLLGTESKELIDLNELDRIARREFAEANGETETDVFDGSSVYMIGEQGLKDALESRGFELTDQRPDFVVVGLDTEVTYRKLEVAVLAILAGATFIGTNADSNLPNERGLTPGAGSLVKLVEYATQTKPIMIGKPEAIIMEMALQRVGLTKEQVVMVGDNYHTDIEAGINVGMDTLLVYTGVSTKEQAAGEEAPPTHVVDSLDDWMVE